MDSNNLLDTKTVNSNEVLGYTVFETLNSRGVGLTVTDLLKNYLFSLAATVDLPHIRAQWDRIVDTVCLDNFPVFLRHYWISKNPLVRQEYLYKIIRTKILRSEDLFYLLEDLEKNVVLYVALSNSADELWKGDRELKKNISANALYPKRKSKLKRQSGNCPIPYNKKMINLLPYFIL